jgi:hypothetical protein
MKNIAALLILTIAVFFGAVTTRAQAPSYIDNVDGFPTLLKTDLPTQKANIIRMELLLTKVESDVFWRLYKRYDNVLQALNAARVALMKDYRAHYDTMTPTKAKELADRAIDLDEKRMLLRKKFYKEFTKALNGKAAARFLQLDWSFELLMDLQIASSTALVK